MRRSNSLAAVATTALLALVGGCAVDPAALPESTLWRCADAAECPSGWSCDVGRALCVPPGVPRLVGSPALSHAFAGPAREVTLRFSVDRDVGDDAAAVALVDASGADVPGGAFARRGEGARDLLFALTPAGVVEGLHFVIITLTSEGGGAATFPAGELVVDATPPGVLSEGVVVEPGLASATSTVTVRVALDEPVENDGDALPLPVARAYPTGGAGDPLAFAAVRLSSAELRFTLDGDGAGGARAAGAYEVFLDGLVDLAGNGNRDDVAGRGLALGSFAVDDAPPDVEILAVTPSVLSPDADDPTVRVCLLANDDNLPAGATSDPPATRPFTLLLDDVDITATCVPAADGAFDASCAGDFSCAYPFDEDDFAEGALPEQGPLLLALTASDAAGNTAADGDALVYDVRPPALFNVLASIAPADDNVVLHPARLTVGSVLAVSFNTDESVRGSGTPESPTEDPVVVVDCGGQLATLVRVPPFASTFFLYGWEVSSPAPPDGPCSASVTMRDVAGNTALVPLAPEPAIVVDATAPPPDTVDAAELVHVRVPWGFVEDPAVGAPYGEPFHLLHAAAFLDEPGLESIPAELIDASADDIRFVRVFDAAEGGAEIGRVFPVYGEVAEDGDGGVPGGDGGSAAEVVAWSLPWLSTRDAPALYLSVVDSAGNESPRRRVERGVWVASLGGKVAGSTVENPHSLVGIPYFATTLALAGAEEGVLEDPVAAPLLVDPPPKGSGDVLDGAAGAGGDPTQRLKGAGTFRRIANAAAPVPPALDGATLSYDAARGRAALFGGSAGLVGSNAYYELASGGWDLRCDGVDADLCFSARPHARRRHAAAYDPRSGLTFLAGGLGASADGEASELLAEVWAFTGSGFLGDECTAEETACIDVVARHGQALLAHPDGLGLLVYGGCADAACGALRGDVTLVVGLHDPPLVLCDPASSCAAPAARYDAAVTVDPVARELLLYGGCRAGAPGFCSSSSSELWAFDLDEGEWRQLTVAGDAPPPAAFARFATLRAPPDYVEGPPRHVLAVAGSNDVFDLSVAGDVGTFARVATVDLEGDGDPALASATSLALAADPVERRILLVAGGETWALVTRALDGWVLLGSSTPGPSPEDGYGGATRWSTKLAHHRDSGLLVMQGGQSSLGPMADTWLFNGALWRRACDPCGPGGGGHAVTSSLLPVGGPVLAQDGAATTSFDVVLGEWTSLATFGDAPPALRTGRAFAQVSVDGDVVLLGGRDAVGLVKREAFVLTAAGEWIDASASLSNGGPKARADAMMAYDPYLAQTVLFGGCDSALGACALDDTWIATWDGVARELSWAEVAGDGPPARSRGALTYDFARGVVALYGGAAGGRSLDDVWELGSSGWVERDVVDADADGAPGERADVSWAQDALGGGLVVFGGSGGFAHGWRWEGGAGRSPAHLAFFRLAAAGLPEGTAIDLVLPRWLSGGESMGAPGVAVLAWEQGRWRAIGGSATAALASPEVVVGYAQGAGAQRLPVGSDDTLAFALLPGANGQGIARVTSLYADVFVLYTLP